MYTTTIGRITCKRCNIERETHEHINKINPGIGEDYRGPLIVMSGETYLHFDIKGGEVYDSEQPQAAAVPGFNPAPLHSTRTENSVHSILHTHIGVLFTSLFRPYRESGFHILLSHV